MDRKLKNKTALVTGSTAGIGYAIAKSLANERCSRITAQIAFTRSLAELIRNMVLIVNTVLPGPTLSEGVGDSLRRWPKIKVLQSRNGEGIFNKMRGTSIIKRFIKPDEIANWVTYVASLISAATNGATLRADGGVIKTAF